MVLHQYCKRLESKLDELTGTLERMTAGQVHASAVSSTLPPPHTVLNNEQQTILHNS
jgi:hypothetical protein